MSFFIFFFKKTKVNTIVETEFCKFLSFNSFSISLSMCYVIELN